MTERTAREDLVSHPVACAVCGRPFLPNDATLYLRMENVLMHGECRPRPWCRDGGKPIEAEAASATA